ncbi:MAG: xylulokinase [Candidatus Latescibacteria bacterium]|nr:xylulokinase [Candidatus Latescibacterota bacterium]
MAHHIIGIDLGTSGVRAAIFDDEGRAVAEASRQYPISTPSPGRAEQDPEAWWRHTRDCLAEAISSPDVSPGDIAGISFSGQMHGTVFLDAYGVPLHPAVIWADSRSGSECREIEEILGGDRLEKTVMNSIFPGTQASTIRWFMRHEPGLWKRTRHILSPKDYIRFRMCGLYHTEPSDASATLLFDVPDRDWSEDVLSALNIPVERLPFVVNSDQHVGDTEGMSDAGVPDGVPLVMGGGDQPCTALGNGIIDEGAMLVTIGTGGQLFAPSNAPITSPGRSLNTFCHVHETRWYVMGATLSAGLSLRWFRDTAAPGVTFDDLAAEAGTVPPGSDGVLFAPYLAGKRSPDLRPDAMGAFHGLRADHGRGHLARAVMEGVSFDLLENLDVMTGMGLVPERLLCTGGAARSGLWMRIAADVFDRPVAVAQGENRACLGAALTAGVGIGVYDSWRDAVDTAAQLQVSIIEPSPENAALYRERYEAYLDIVQ